jgi:nucleotide-binding universal stress UspA family protein
MAGDVGTTYLQKPRTASLPAPCGLLAAIIVPLQPVGMCIAPGDSLGVASMTLKKLERGEAGLENPQEQKMRVLLAVDGSESSEAAAQMVLEQAHPSKAEVHVLNVLRPPTLLLAREMVGYPSLENTWEMQAYAAGELVKSVATKVRAKGIKTTSAVEMGEPRAKILEVAQAWHADLIVLGSHQRTRLARYLSDGIPEAVARRASCSVEIVRAPAEGGCPDGWNPGKEETCLRFWSRPKVRARAKSIKRGPQMAKARQRGRRLAAVGQE